MAVYNCQLLFEVGDNGQVFPFLRRGGYQPPMRLGCGPIWGSAPTVWSDFLL